MGKILHATYNLVKTLDNKGLTFFSRARHLLTEPYSLATSKVLEKYTSHVIRRLKWLPNERDAILAGAKKDLETMSGQHKAGSGKLKAIMLSRKNRPYVRANHVTCTAEDIGKTRSSLAVIAAFYGLYDHSLDLATTNNAVFKVFKAALENKRSETADKLGFMDRLVDRCIENKDRETAEHIALSYLELLGKEKTPDDAGLIEIKNMAAIMAQKVANFLSAGAKEDVWGFLRQSFMKCFEAILKTAGKREENSGNIQVALAAHSIAKEWFGKGFLSDEQVAKLEDSSVQLKLNEFRMIYLNQ